MIMIIMMDAAQWSIKVILAFKIESHYIYIVYIPNDEMNTLEKTINEVVSSKLFYKENFSLIMEMINKPFTMI